LADGAAPALELLADGAAPALELLADGAAPALELLADGAAAIELLPDGGEDVCCADARCENCIPTIVKEVRSIAEIAIAESIAYVFLWITRERLAMKFICFRPLIKKYTMCNILPSIYIIFTKYGNQPTILYAFFTASI